MISIFAAKEIGMIKKSERIRNQTFINKISLKKWIIKKKTLRLKT
ncbi:hypothetical protein COO91_01347 [Nostoc flagelliforme CCNUN1]|uniref:Uncharacterized protein n=1 Tax=Nostoc flagelliforme CCNUN1 TaxID=2038116 RepID=A0A2K8SJ62_9NOSO|nr:hypothetical protein COO91_01347 [Nostoc flagelliforme CCNUN1]